jgi:hypothetical protein
MPRQLPVAYTQVFCTRVTVYTTGSIADLLLCTGRIGTTVLLLPLCTSDGTVILVRPKYYFAVHGERGVANCESCHRMCVQVPGTSTCVRNTRIGEHFATQSANTQMLRVQVNPVQVPVQYTLDYLVLRTRSCTCSTGTCNYKKFDDAGLRNSARLKVD